MAQKGKEREMSNYNYYEEYYDSYGEEGGFVKNRRHKEKKKFKGKGHQSRKSESERWAEIIEASDGGDEYVPYKEEKKEFANNAYSKYQKKEGQETRGNYGQKTSEPKKFVANPETTKNIKGVDIDFGGVVAMTKEDSEAKGYKTYGIRFTFKGTKGLYRIVWFNKNVFLRDKIFDEKKAYWDSLQTEAKGR